MEYYKKINKPSNDSFKALIDNYNYVKGLDSSVVFNEGTEDEYVFVPCEDIDEYPCTFLSKEDVYHHFGYEGSDIELSADDMRACADRVNDFACESGSFWDAIDYTFGNQFGEED